MAWYPQAVRKNIPPGPNDPPIKPRLAILHVAATEADSLYGWFNGPSAGIESHFYVKYDGSVEQYRDTAYQADANVMANDFAVSIETQGLANGTWTDAQLATIKALLTWLHATHGIPLVVPATWDGSGVGYHVLFEAQWDQRGASCPGPNRIAQFKNVLVPWMAAGGNGDDMSAQDVKAVNDYTAALVVYGYDSNGKRQPSLAQQINTLSAQVAALSTAVTALANAKGADAAAITKAVVDKVASLQLTLTPKE